jgi:molybdopterin-containing oxidoreductase family iron-sulfur binding subunit
MRFNPEVTVRMRGVMEKCTYCTQRINAAKHTAKIEHAKGERASAMVQDGEVVTACEQSCPTNAIVFGNLADPNSRIARLYNERKTPRAYGMLDGHLNTRPRTKHLARITNPSPELAAHEGAGKNGRDKHEQDKSGHKNDAHAHG